MGRSDGGGRIYQSGVFRGKRALLPQTTGGPEDAHRRGGINGDIAGILRLIHRGMLQLVGFDVLAPRIVYEPVRLTVEERKRALVAYAVRLQTIDRELPIDDGMC